MMAAGTQCGSPADVLKGWQADAGGLGNCRAQGAPGSSGELRGSGLQRLQGNRQPTGRMASVDLRFESDNITCVIYYVKAR